jgi:hypothetical protein
VLAAGLQGEKDGYMQFGGTEPGGEGVAGGAVKGDVPFGTRIVSGLPRLWRY